MQVLRRVFRVHHADPLRPKAQCKQPQQDGDLQLCRYLSRRIRARAAAAAVGRQLLGIELPAAAAVEVGVFIALRMEQQISAQKEKKNVLLIAPGNIHLSLLSYWQMVNRLGSLLNRIEVCSYQAVIASPLPKDVDFVISTVELPNLGHHYEVV